MGGYEDVMEIIRIMRVIQSREGECCVVWIAGIIECGGLCAVSGEGRSVVY